MGMIEVIRGVERRRRWSVEEKLSILAETAQPGATVSGTARRHDLHPNQIFRWRQLARRGRLASPGVLPEIGGFAPVGIVDSELGDRPRRDGPHFAGTSGMVEIALSNGRIVRVDERIEPPRLSRLISALDG